MSPAQTPIETPRDEMPSTAYPFGAFALGMTLGVRQVAKPLGERSGHVAR